MNKLFETSQSLTPLTEVYENVVKEIQTRTEDIKYKTGLSDLDDILWGLRKGDLYVIGARTSQGKSDLSLFLAKNLADCGANVVYFSLEMTKEQLLERMICNMCEINNEDLRRGLGLDKLKDHENIVLKWLEDANFYIDDLNGHHFDKIIGVCKLTKPDFVFLDYIQLINVKGYKDKLSAMEDFVKEIKLLGQVNRFGTVLVSQINREGVERPYMHQLKNAGILEEHPSVVILLQSIWERNEFNIFVEKNRHGRVGKLRAIYEPQYSRFSDSLAPTPIARKDWND